MKCEPFIDFGHVWVGGDGNLINIQDKTLVDSGPPDFYPLFTIAIPISDLRFASDDK